MMLYEKTDDSQKATKVCHWRIKDKEEIDQIIRQHKLWERKPPYGEKSDRVYKAWPLILKDQSLILCSLRAITGVDLLCTLSNSDWGFS